MKRVKVYAPIILFAAFSVVSLGMGIVKYSEFLKIHGFLEIDAVFIVTTLAISLIILLDTAKPKSSWKLAVSGLILCAIWLIMSWVAFPKDLRVLNLIDVLWFPIGTSVFTGTTYRLWRQRASYLEEIV